jgi:hypothetical protein
MPTIRFLKGMKKGKIEDVPEEQLKVLDTIGTGLYEIVDKATKPKTPDPDEEMETNVKGSETVSMGSVHTNIGEYLILESDTPVTVVLTKTEVVKNTYEDDETGRTWERYEIPVLHDGKATTLLLPPSVVENMWKQIVNKNMRPVEEKHPTFVISKSGTGIKTRYSVNLVSTG